MPHARSRVIGRRAPPQLKAMLERMGTSIEAVLRGRWAFVGRLHRAGVRLISGGDSGISASKPHGMLPQAIQELVLSGLSVAEAVASATSGAGDALGLADRKGRLLAGYDADLLIVDGDLSSDVNVLSRPQAVHLRGAPITL